MAVPTVSVTGKVLTPTGAAANGGNIVFELNRPGSVIDPASSARERIGGQVVALIGTDGTLNFNLVPNDVIYIDGNQSAGGTRYNARVNVTAPTRSSWLEVLNVKSAPNPVVYGAIERELNASTLMLGRAVSKAVTLEDPQASDALAICQLDRLVAVDHVAAAITDGDPGASVTFNLQHGPSFPLAINLWSAHKVCSYGGAGLSYSGPYQDATIAQGNYLGLKVFGVSGSVREFNVTVYYLE